MIYHIQIEYIKHYTVNSVGTLYPSCRIVSSAPKDNGQQRKCWKYQFDRLHKCASDLNYFLSERGIRFTCTERIVTFA